MRERDSDTRKAERRAESKVALWPALGPLWGGSTLTLFVEQYISFAIPLLLVTRVGAPVSVAQFATFAFFVPYLALGLNAGVWLEGKSHKRSLWLSTGTQFSLLILLCLSITMAPKLAWPYLVFILGSGVAAVFFQISFQSIIPSYWNNEHQLYEVNARLAMSDAVMRVLGPAAAGILIGHLSAANSTAIVAMATLAAAILFTVLPRPTAHPDSKKERNNKGVPTRELILQGLKFVRDHDWLNPIIACGAYYIIFITTIKTTVALYLVENRGQSSAQVGLSISCIAAGYAVGSILGKKLAQLSGPKYSLQLGAAIATTGASAAALTATMAGPKLLLVLVSASLFFHGLGDGMFAPIALSVRQTQTPTHLMSRVTAVHRFFIWGGMSLGGLLAAIATYLSSAHTTLLISALATWGTLPLLYRRALRLEKGER